MGLTHEDAVDGGSFPTSCVHGAAANAPDIESAGFGDPAPAIVRHIEWSTYIRLGRGRPT